MCREFRLAQMTGPDRLARFRGGPEIQEIQIRKDGSLRVKVCPKNPGLNMIILLWGWEIF